MDVIIEAAHTSGGGTFQSTAGTSIGGSETCGNTKLFGLPRTGGDSGSRGMSFGGRRGGSVTADAAGAGGASRGGKGGE